MMPLLFRGNFLKCQIDIDAAAALDELDADDGLAVGVLTGAGKGFCAGMDLKAFTAGEAAAITGSNGGFAGIVTRSFEKPLIAAVNGPAAGLGMDLALACDLVAMGERAWMAASFVDRGLVPDGGSMYFLPRRIGIARAKEILLSGRRVGAAEAVEIGLAERRTDGDVLEMARELAEGVAAKPAASMMLTKEILNRSSELSLELVAQLGAEAQAICYTTSDRRAAVEAFPERRSIADG